MPAPKEFAIQYNNSPGWLQIAVTWGDSDSAGLGLVRHVGNLNFLVGFIVQPKVRNVLLVDEKKHIIAV